MRRTVIVGDVHACFDELLDLLDLVALRPEDLLVSVGDLVDRGPQPAEAVRFFRERPNSVVVMGNHERKHVRGILSYSQEITRLQLGGDYAETVAWMRTLPYYFENEHVRVVHAAMLSGLPLAEQREELLCGTTSGQRRLAALFPEGAWHDHYTDAKPVAFGHHVVGREPMTRDGRVYGLDTGACHGGRLTALCVPGFTLHSVDARADHWSIVGRQWQLPVLKAAAWPDLTWQELAAKAARFSRGADEETHAWLRAVLSWAEELRSAFPDLLAEADRLARELPAEEMRRHPAAPQLFQARAGRLDPAARCTSPRATIDLAAKLGRVMPDLPG
ncbi:metallophosphoesterase [Nonomuraea longicatena]|uniref:Calcineurin-like phosphoesterase domain-containing protein n=1 Tax=Nonomuraea longicatena TaxID=83682 RepID=A0ABN1Q2K0_9ACTN